MLLHDRKIDLRLNYLVTGTGRSGTVFMARLLSSVGIACGHEMFFGPDMLPVEEKLRQAGSLSLCSTYDRRTDARQYWLQEAEVIADASYMSAPYLDHPLLATTKLIEVVRHPLKVISSFVMDGHFFSERYPTNQWEEFIYTHVPAMTAEPTHIGRACVYYTQWCKLIRQKATPRRYVHRIEDQVTPSLLSFLLRPDATEYHTTPENSWKRRDRDFGVDELPEPWRTAVVEIGEGYGYRF